MARELRLVCDVCGKPTDKIVGKIFFTPAIPGLSRAVHSNYSHHSDVGVCCQARVIRGLRMKKRQTAKEYHARRRAGNG